jgi:hypothetical protein
MGRFFRFLKLASLIGGTSGAVFLFSAFSHSPQVTMSLQQRAIDVMIENKESFPETVRDQIAKLESDKEAKQRSVFKDLARPIQKLNSLEDVKGRDLKNQTDSSAHRGTVSAASAGITQYGGRDWVFIEGKYYVYNPKNVYLVNGVSMFYKPDMYDEKLAEESQSVSDTSVSVSAKVAQAKPAAAFDVPTSGNTAIDKAKAVLHGYSPAGMAELKQNLQQIQEGMKARNEALKALEKE